MSYQIFKIKPTVGKWRNWGDSIKFFLSTIYYSQCVSISGITSLSLASNGDHNGACSILGATGIVTNPVASAEIEEGEGDVVEIDSPLSTQVNVMSLIHNSMPVPQVMKLWLFII